MKAFNSSHSTKSMGVTEGTGIIFGSTHASQFTNTAQFSFESLPISTTNYRFATKAPIILKGFQVPAKMQNGLNNRRLNYVLTATR